jgi:hypothetical protein
VARQRERMIGIVAMVNIRDLDIGFVDSGFNGHDESQTKKPHAKQQWGLSQYWRRL